MSEIPDMTLESAQNDLLEVTSDLEGCLQHVEGTASGRALQVGKSVDKIKDAVAHLERARSRGD